MTMSEEPPPIFPCDFPIKIFGRNAPDFRAAVLKIVRSHCRTLRDEDVRERASRAGRYLSLTVTVRMRDRAQADTIYRELTASDRVLMVL